MELIMGDNDTKFRFNHEETVPTYTIGAAFTLAIALGLIVVSGVLPKPDEAREVVKNIHERILMEKEYRELSRINYSYNKIAFSQADDTSFPESTTLPAPSYAVTLPAVLPDKPTQKTERAQSFDREVKSDEYWKGLQASITGISPSLPGSAPIVLPPVVVGSAD